MNTLILVHSKTGITMKLAEAIRTEAIRRGHQTTLLTLETDRGVKPQSIREPIGFHITNLPDPADFDLILIGGPVWAFSASPVAYQALAELPDLPGKRFAAFGSHGLPFRFMGANSAQKAMDKLAREKKALVLPGLMLMRSRIYNSTAIEVSVKSFFSGLK